MMHEQNASSECLSLKDPRGKTTDFIFSTREQAIVQGDGAPLTDLLAGGFIVKFLRVGVRSAFWEPFTEADAPASSKLKALVRYLVRDGHTTNATSEFE